MEKQYIQFKKQRELGEIITDTFAFIRNEFKPFFNTLLKIVGPYIVAMLVALAMYFYFVGDLVNFASLENKSSDFSPLVLFLVLPLFLITVLSAYVMAQGTVLHYIKSYIENQGTIVFDDVKSRVYKSFWSLLGLSIIVAICVGIGLVLCVLPGIYLGVTLSISFAILIFLETDTGDAFQSSFKFIKDNWWITFATFFVLYIIIIVVSIAFSLPSTVYTWVKIGVFSGEVDAESFNLFNDPIYIILNLISSLIQFLMNLIMIIATTLIFFNLNERKNHTGTLEKIENLGTSSE